jgi:hypothetical protein
VSASSTGGVSSSTSAPVPGDPATTVRGRSDAATRGLDAPDQGDLERNVSNEVDGEGRRVARGDVSRGVAATNESSDEVGKLDMSARGQGEVRRQEAKARGRVDVSSELPDGEQEARRVERLERRGDQARATVADPQAEATARARGAAHGEVNQRTGEARTRQAQAEGVVGAVEDPAGTARGAAEDAARDKQREAKAEVSGEVEVSATVTTKPDKK